MSLSSTTTTTTTSPMMPPKKKQRDKTRRQHVPLLLESFPAPPSFIPASPRPSVSSVSSPVPNPSLNPPPSLPPSSPLPPVPGPSPISESDTFFLLSSANRSRRSSKLSVTSRPPSAYTPVGATDSSRDSIASSTSLCSNNGRSISPGAPPSSSKTGSPLVQSPSFGKSHSRVASTRGIDPYPSISEEDFDSGIAADSYQNAVPAAIAVSAHDDDDDEAVLALADDSFASSASSASLLPYLSPPCVPSGSGSVSPSPLLPSTHVPNPPPRKRTNSNSSLLQAIEQNIQAQTVHRQARAERSRSEGHKRLLREKSVSPLPPPSPAAEDGVLGASFSRLSTVPSAMPQRPPRSSRSPTNPPQRTPLVSALREKERALSPDITTIISKTPRAPRRSSPFFTAFSFSSSTGPKKAGLRIGPFSPRSRTMTLSTEGSDDGEEGYGAEGEDSFVSDYGVLMPSGGTPSSFGLLGGPSAPPPVPPQSTSRSASNSPSRSIPPSFKSQQPSASLAAVGEFENMEASLDARDRAEGEASDSDSSIDLHTPLPHLMVRHGLLSPRSKLLPQDTKPSAGGGEQRPGSMMSLQSKTSTQTLLKDERDTPSRRTRHRDGRLLRGGIGLTTGLGWSDSEDEDAPSPLTRRLSLLNLGKSPAGSRRGVSAGGLRLHLQKGSRADVPPTAWSGRASAPQPVSLSNGPGGEGAGERRGAPVRRTASESNALNEVRARSGTSITVARTNSSASSGSAPSIPLPKTPEGDDRRHLFGHNENEKDLPPIPILSSRAGLGDGKKKYPSHLSLAKASAYAASADMLERARTYSSASSASSSGAGPGTACPVLRKDSYLSSVGGSAMHSASSSVSTSEAVVTPTRTGTSSVSTPTSGQGYFARQQALAQHAKEHGNSPVTPRPLRLGITSSVRPDSGESAVPVPGVGRRGSSSVGEGVGVGVKTRSPSSPYSAGLPSSASTSASNFNFKPTASSAPNSTLPSPSSPLSSFGGSVSATPTANPAPAKPKPRTGTGMMYRTGSASGVGGVPSRMRLPTQGLMGHSAPNHGSRVSSIASRPIAL